MLAKYEKKILIITSNTELSEFFNNQFELHPEKSKYKLDFRTSPGSNLTINGNVIESIDLRDPLTVHEIIESYELIISLHSLQIFPSVLVNSVCCLNIHPGYNPHNRGFFSQVFSILNSLPIGATIHLIDEGIDTGPIIDQECLTTNSCDTSFTVYRRIVDAEKRLIERNLGQILDGTFDTVGLQSKGNYNSKKNFDQLCELDLSANGTLGEHIKLLRALTHPGFKNSFYFCENGIKHFVSINIEDSCG
jgi:methionyl-tRNA formyltransferase